MYFVLGDIATGVLRYAVCHPKAVSFVKVAVPSSRPLASHTRPMCTPFSLASLQYLMATTRPAWRDVNFVPNSRVEPSLRPTRLGDCPAKIDWLPDGTK